MFTIFLKTNNMLDVMLDGTTGGEVWPGSVVWVACPKLVKDVEQWGVEKEENLVVVGTSETLLRVLPSPAEWASFTRRPFVNHSTELETPFFAVVASEEVRVEGCALLKVCGGLCDGEHHREGARCPALVASMPAVFGVSGTLHCPTMGARGATFRSRSLATMVVHPATLGLSNAEVDTAEEDLDAAVCAFFTRAGCQVAVSGWFKGGVKKGDAVDVNRSMHLTSVKFVGVVSDAAKAARFEINAPEPPQAEPTPPGTE
jgi:hypothetical protein